LKKKIFFLFQNKWEFEAPYLDPQKINAARAKETFSQQGHKIKELSRGFNNWVLDIVL